MPLNTDVTLRPTKWGLRLGPQHPSRCVISHICPRNRCILWRTNINHVVPRTPCCYPAPERTPALFILKLPPQCDPIGAVICVRKRKVRRASAIQSGTVYFCRTHRGGWRFRSERFEVIVGSAAMLVACAQSDEGFWRLFPVLWRPVFVRFERENAQVPSKKSPPLDVAKV